MTSRLLPQARMNTNSEEIPCYIAGKKVIVAGAGIGGLAFASALSKQLSSLPPSLSPPSITIYERDSLDATGREGYSMSIRSDGVSGGMQTLQKLGILDSTFAASVTGTQGGDHGEFCLWDRDWKEIMRASVPTRDGLPKPHMRIARNVLRKQLLDAVPEKSVEIRWGIACTGAVKLEDGRVGVRLSDGTIDECDLLVAADGSRSKVLASLKPDQKLNFAGAVLIMANARFEGGIPKPVDRDWGLFLNGSGQGLFVSPVDEKNAVWSLTYRSQTPREGQNSGFEGDQYEKLIKEVMERGKAFKEPFSTLVKATDPSTLRISNAFDRQPFGHQDIDLNVVFIGDANHAVSPFAGNGANMAMMDAWDLAEQLCKHETLESALKAYDSVAIPRAKAVIKFSHRTIALAHATGWRFWLYSFVLRIINKFRGW